LDIYLISYHNAGGEIRTLNPFRAIGFKPIAYAIPPHRRIYLLKINDQVMIEENHPASIQQDLANLVAFSQSRIAALKIPNAKEIANNAK
jgi:hypothetical protein